MTSRNRSFGFVSGLVVTLSFQVASADDPKAVISITEATKKLNAATQARKLAPTLEARIRESTWRLLVGELASDKSVGLSSNAYESLARGVLEIDKILGELEQTPELETQLSSQPQLAMRFDAAVARRTEAIAKKDLSRADELARLSQLRELNGAYRNVIRHLISAQTEALLGETDATVKSGEAVSRQLKLAEEIVGKRRDYYLFEEEPATEGVDAELKLVQEAATPYDKDAGRHQRAILGLTLCRLAMQADPSDKALLEAGVMNAELALADATSPSSIAFFAQGLGALELGRLVTRDNPFSEQLHSSAAKLFRKSQDAFTAARKSIPDELKLATLRAELDRLIEEGDTPNLFLEQAQRLQQRGDYIAAAALLNRGATRHYSRELALAAVDSLWRSGANPKDVDAITRNVVSGGVISADDPEYRALQGQIRVLGVWNLLMDQGDTVDENQPKLLEQLTAGLADFKAVPSDAPEELRWRVVAMSAFGESAALLIDKSRETSEATHALEQIPVIVAELEKLMVGQPLRVQERLLEAIQCARLAEGYLSLRLSPDYQDRSRLAFASAADVGAKLSQGAIGSRPAGSAVLRALLHRDGAGSDRLAQEERQLRISLQKMLPALAAMPVGEPKEIANSVLAAQRDARTAEPSWDAQKQLDLRDTAGARTGMLADSRAVTAMALVAAQLPDLAMKELLTDLWPEMHFDNAQSLDWKDVQKKSKAIADPLSAYALGLVIEEFAVTQVATNPSLHVSLLKQALDLFDQSATTLGRTAIWRERWPYLQSLAQAGHDRLVSDESDIRRARSLKEQLRLTDARELLDKTRQRHPHSIRTRHIFAQLLIDEAQLSPQLSTALLSRATETLADIQNHGDDLSTEMMLELGEMYERVGNREGAVVAYRKVADHSENAVEKLKARSRIALMQIRPTE